MDYRQAELTIFDQDGEQIAKFNCFKRRCRFVAREWAETYNSVNIKRGERRLAHRATYLDKEIIFNDILAAGVRSV